MKLYSGAVYERLLRDMKKRGDVEFITYADLAWGDEWDYAQNNPAEWRRWKAKVSNGEVDPSKIYLLLQHDTDSGPVESITMAECERSIGARSSIMTLARWIDRRTVGDAKEYSIDWSALVELQRQGFGVGYHCNALRVSRFDAQKVFTIFDEDVESLRRRGLRIEYFSPHGGPASPSGQLNSSFDYPAMCRHRLRWVCTGFSARFHGYFSDGKAVGHARLGTPLPDLGEFLATMEPGRRYRALVHPQYYDFGTR